MTSGRLFTNQIFTVKINQNFNRYTKASRETTELPQAIKLTHITDWENHLGIRRFLGMKPDKEPKKKPLSYFSKA